MPSFWFGDYIFNGNIAKAVDKISSKYGFEKGTFIKSDKKSLFGAHPKEIKEVIEQVESKLGAKKANLAGKIATGIFISGFIAHSLAMCCVFLFANAITRKWVTKDLSKINSADETNNKKRSLKCQG